jgi:thymidylate synthase (FAD)
MELYTPEFYRVQSTDNKQASEDKEYIEHNEAAKMTMKQANEYALNTYNYLLSMGVCREQARSILPQNMMTTFYCTMNLRNCLHFLSLRMDKHAQWEIRQYANAIHEMLVEHYPNVMEAFDKGLIS